MNYTTGTFDTSIRARVELKVKVPDLSKIFEPLAAAMKRFGEVLVEAFNEMWKFVSKWILPLAPQRPKIAYRTPLRVGTPIFPTTVNYRHRGAR